MKKSLILVHRWLGVAISLLMAAWCVSGIVMMYVGFPALDEQERRAGLPPIDFEGCCAFEQAVEAVGEVPVESFAVEMLAGRPVLKVVDAYGSVLADLRSGEVIVDVGAVEARRIAEDFQASRDHSGAVVPLDTIETDQWTVTGAYDPYRPLHRFAVGDPARTHLYVAGTNGEVVLDTTARERFWNWLGAVTHWLYPSALRANAALWAQVVIWTSLVGAFLTVTGLWLGLLQVRAGRTRRFSPYRGWNWVHHVSGLVFGILTLTWVLSGFFSMSPWGLFDGTGSRAERERLQGSGFSSRDAVAALERLVAADVVGSDIRRISSAPLAGRLYLTLEGVGTPVRLDATSLSTRPLSRGDLEQLASRLRPGVPVAGTDWLEHGDEYYYDSHDGRRSYPVFRVVLADDERTRYYLDPVDGALLQKTDRDGRWYRWLFEALHRWDFSPALRERPLWDLLVLPLMIGVTALSFTGVYLGFRRVRPGRKRIGDSGQGTVDSG